MNNRSTSLHHNMDILGFHLKYITTDVLFQDNIVLLQIMPDPRFIHHQDCVINRVINRIINHAINRVQTHILIPIFRF